MAAILFRPQCVNNSTIMNVLYCYLASDHFVLSVKLENVINEMPPDLCNDSDDTFNIERVHWDRPTCNILSKYTDLSDSLPRVRGFWYGFVGVCSLTYCNGNFRFTRVSELLIVNL